MRIGILGGGQLGQMLGTAARSLGLRVIVLDPDPDCPAAVTAHAVVPGRLDDPAAVRRLAAQCDVLTLETEHVPVAVLEAAEAIVPVRPGSSVLRLVADRLAQKRFLATHKFPQPAFAWAHDSESLLAAVERVGTPCVLKNRTGGYDGRGQARVRLPEDALAAWHGTGAQPCIVERFVAFEREVSVLIACALDGTRAFWPIAENDHLGSVLHTTVVPAGLTPAQAEAARTLGGAVAGALRHVGVLALELFVERDGSLLINEIAPRVHNSGHFTWGASPTSQFEQHLRCVAGLPLGPTQPTVPVAMLNLLGDLWHDGQPPPLPAWAADVDVHLYGKRDARPGRKMGHILVRAATATDALDRARRLHAECVGLQRPTAPGPDP
ncbi:MAG: 5-(carboxyamino)imidazole ribonucleotide synthase [Myxococcales bacterium]|nr:5-(carboxyamino)imidazole ribonucleotide synthase [Myxococcales bacterium]